jgi:hypothetical protein
MNDKFNITIKSAVGNENVTAHRSGLDKKLPVYHSNFIGILR